MVIPATVGVTLVIVRPMGRDRYGDPIDGEATRFEVHGCAVAPRVGGPGTASADLEARGREGVREGLTAYLPFGPDGEPPDVRHTDIVEFDGKLWEIDGEPSVWRSPFTGWPAGVEVALTRGEG